MKKRVSVLWQLFSVFSRIGLFTFGGGLAMLPMLQKEIVVKHKWATDEEMLDYFALGQSVPGIVAINVATFIGHKKKGVVGALCATLGIILPSWAIIVLIATLFQQFSEYVPVQKALLGIRVAVATLITGAVITMAKKAIADKTSALIAVLALLLVVWQGVSPIYIIISSALAGYFLFPLRTKDKSL